MLAELRNDGSGAAEDKTPLGKNEEIDNITEEDYFIKNAEVACYPTSMNVASASMPDQAQTPGCEECLIIGALLMVSCPSAVQ